MTYQSKHLASHPTLPARVMQVETAHGSFQTPTFMPVATRAYMNLASPEEVHSTGSQIILGGNTYHMLVKPGMEVIEANGGMHRMMGWSGPMLTDSGGFQVFSLSKNSNICKIDEIGATFKHPFTGQKIKLNSVTSIETQKIIGADIIMAFDQCTPEAGGRQAAEVAMARTHRWLAESIETHMKHPQSAYGYDQALFGIIQGGRYQDLREQSAEFILQQPLDGLAIGGETIGFDMEKTVEIIDWIRPILPKDKVRYTMGVGLNPRDLVAVVSAGIDIFDCVAPTRNARHGSLYNIQYEIVDNWIQFIDHEEEKLLIKKTKYAKDTRPIMEGCECSTCKQYTRSYLHYLFKEKSNFYLNLAAIHNIHVMQMVCDVMRDLIMENKP
jgi:queuine tRNA-ribosyltransferase